MKKKILLSAYACNPKLGSESMLGWQWAVQLADRGFEVWVLTRETNKLEIEQYLAANLIHGQLKFIYYNNSMLLPVLKILKARFRYFYYYAWQWGAYKLAEQEHKSHHFDIVHHITWVQVRMPSFMGKLGIPFVIGPVGGGESPPFRIRWCMGIRQWSLDLLRDIWSFISSIDPFVKQTYKDATRILVTSLDSEILVPTNARSKTKIQLAIAYEPSNYYRHSDITCSSQKKGLSFLFVGRFLGLKGISLGLPAFARLLKQYPESSLTLVGDGPSKNKWKKIAKKLNISDKIEWIKWLPRNEVELLYSKYDALLFPSLHDSGGFVVLEAMSLGLPVICLDIGGPGIIVTKDCGIKVDVKKCSIAKVEQQLATALLEFSSNRELRNKLSKGAMRRAAEFGWDNLISSCYGPILVDSTKHSPKID